MEQMSRLEIIVALNTHGLQQHLDVVEGVGAQRNMSVLSGYNDEESDDNRDQCVFGRGTEFFDPRYCLLDKLAPSLTQTLLSYLVELCLISMARVFLTRP